MQPKLDCCFATQQPGFLFRLQLTTGLVLRLLHFFLVIADAREYKRRWLFERLGADFGWFVFAFDDQFDGGVADLLFGVVAFDKLFAAVFA